jgi:branched-chain amino acid transport system substrate-binding protein
MRGFRLPALSLAAVLALGTGAARADITIGVAGPMTGPEAQFGEQFRQGADKAVADINAKGGLLGQKLNYIMGDDACEPKQAVAVANDLAAKKVPFVAGHFCSGTSIPASEVYSETGVLEISPGSTNPVYTERKLPNTFRVCGRDDQQGSVAADYVAAKLKGKVVAVIHDKSAYGKGLADEFKKALNAKGVTEVFYEAITAGEKDYTALVTKAKAAKVDVLFLGGYKTEGGLIVRQMRDQGMKTVLMGGDALLVEEFWAITGAAGEGTLVTFSPDPRRIPANADLVKYFRDKKYEPESYTLYTYAAIQVWAQAAEKAKSTDSKKVAAVLKSEKFNTVLGNIGFDAKGDVAAPGYVVYVWKNGKYDYAE